MTVIDSHLRNTVVVASAGTGKTYRLVSEFVETVLGDGCSRAPIPPRSILALTFTEKAAAEMKTRIFLRFSEMTEDVAKQRKYLRDLEQATVSTYHSFCAKILREYGRHLNLDTSFRLLDAFEDADLSRKIAKRVVLKRLGSQKKDVLALVARLGFGGGNELVGVVGHLVKAKEQLIENGVHPKYLQKIKRPGIEEFLSSVELRSLLAKCESAFAAYEGVSLSKLACEKVERSRKVFCEIKEVILESDADSIDVKVSSVFGELREAVSGRFGPDVQRRDLVSAISNLGSQICGAFLVSDEEAFVELLKEYWATLEIEKKSSMTLGFGDLLMMTRDLLRENIAVRREVKARYQKVLVDEYQDSSPIQEEIVTLICETSEDEREFKGDERALLKIQFEKGKLFVVGDPKQSIYGFRGADVSLFKDMEQEVSREGGLIESLNLSRRSSASVVAVVNQAVPCPERERLVALSTESLLAGGILVDENESAALANEISALLHGKSKVGMKSFEPGDIVVLVRRIKKAHPILSALTEQGIPARVLGGEGFFERLEVIELVSALRLVVNPEDKIALLTVLRSPLVSLSDSSMLLLFKSVVDKSANWNLECVQQFFEEEGSNEEDKIRFLKLYEAVIEIRSKSAMISAQEALRIIFSVTNYLKEIEKGLEASLCKANIKKLIDLFTMSESDFVGQVMELSRKVELAPKEAMGEENVLSNAVRIMTIHQSKGLEFPVVFLADTSASIPSDSSDVLFEPELGIAISYRGAPIAVCAPEGKEWQEQFPTPIQAIRRRLREKNENELIRLLYVGLTRAKELIYFCDTQTRSKPATEKRCTLRNLFFKGMSEADESVRCLMPEVFTNESFLEPVTEGEDWNRMGEDNIAAQSDNIERRLLYASSLLDQVKDEKPALRAQRLSYQPSLGLKGEFSSTDLGCLAHYLIQTATGQLSLGEFENHEIIRSALKTSLRFKGIKEFDPFAQIIDACATTLETVILPLLKTGFKIEFEVPISLSSALYEVKGFADAVATRGNISCVIDFKSSQFAAQSESARLQLLTYCAAMKERAENIYFSSSVIGDAAPLDFHEFTSECFREIQDYIHKIA